MPAGYVEHHDADIGVGAQGEGDLSSAASGRHRSQAVTRYRNNGELRWEDLSGSGGGDCWRKLHLRVKAVVSCQLSVNGKGEAAERQRRRATGTRLQQQQRQVAGQRGRTYTVKFFPPGHPTRPEPSHNAPPSSATPTPAFESAKCRVCRWRLCPGGVQAAVRHRGYVPECWRCWVPRVARQPVRLRPTKHG